MYAHHVHIDAFLRRRLLLLRLRCATLASIRCACVTVVVASIETLRLRQRVVCHPRPFEADRVPRARRGLQLLWRPRAGRGRDSDRRRARAIHGWMVRGRGRCGGCQAVLHKFRNKVIDRRCGSCSATLSEYDRYAYHCELCQRFACKQCTNASRGSSVAPKPLLACDGCQGVLVRMRITRAFVNRPCHNCSSTFEYLDCLPL